MMKEYRTIHEVSGPLMVVDHVEGVTYDELAEIQLHSGEVRRCKVLEVNDSATNMVHAVANLELVLKEKLEFIANNLYYPSTGNGATTES